LFGSGILDGLEAAADGAVVVGFGEEDLAGVGELPVEAAGNLDGRGDVIDGGEEVFRVAVAECVLGTAKSKATR
jgi:hypothetical protein